MRLALIALACTPLSACSDKAQEAGQERRGAAGEVLGGDVTDAMIPLDTVQSTSPVDPRGDRTVPATGATAGTATPGDRAEEPTPRPSLSAAPLPDMTMPADPEPLRPEPE